MFYLDYKPLVKDDTKLSDLETALSFKNISDPSGKATVTLNPENEKEAYTISVNF